MKIAEIRCSNSTAVSTVGLGVNTTTVLDRPILL